MPYPVGRCGICQEVFGCCFDICSFCFLEHTCPLSDTSYCFFFPRNEHEGIPANLIHHLDVCVEIPQQGIIRSLNVHVSGALLIWEYTRQQVIKQKQQQWLPRVWCLTVQLDGFLRCYHVKFWIDEIQTQGERGLLTLHVLFSPVCRVTFKCLNTLPP